VAYRDDQGWEPDGDGVRFQSGENAYLENIEVRPGLRGGGIGAALLAALEAEAGRLGKRRLWLHAFEDNVGAHRFYESHGWRHQRTVHPSWADGRPTRVYTRGLVAG
jgi:GNAT superfamily N-acetyltransferase